MVRSPPSSWPPLAAILSRLSLRLKESTDGDVSLRVGSGLLPQFCLRALQHSNFDYLRLEVSMLHKVNNGDGSAVSLARIVQDMGAAHSLHVSQGGVVPTHAPRALIAPVASPVPSPPICFFFRDHGHCKFGDKCKFRHVQGATSSSRPSSATTAASSGDACLACGSPQHGIQDCPTHKAQRERSKEGRDRADKTRAALAKVTTELASVRALVASAAPAPLPPGPAPPPPATTNDAQAQEIARLRSQLAASRPPHWDPYYQFGPGPDQGHR
jgi:hypothetical protein